MKAVDMHPSIDVLDTIRQIDGLSNIFVLVNDMVESINKTDAKTMAFFNRNVE
eukprot:CAMPEP_0116952142 /NCGR_PEP_ID=MMETSP0467-20121206/40548_1 /TAXON_ID=283647 /ORGANISM="Mesodinium pulex, Strain SPMC105" /LENGTH=52 /DNA_ID=CAMNT_0004637341 /DNA_START=1523 /DNA_END=1681 /DNA_ORIENTATION=-